MIQRKQRPSCREQVVLYGLETLGGSNFMLLCDLSFLKLCFSSSISLMHRLRQKIHLLSARCPSDLIVCAAIFTDEMRAAPECFVCIAAREMAVSMGL